jgi:regulator of sirC expression with transglutaminase-like and TPR domain
MTQPPADQVLFAHLVGRSEGDIDLASAALVLGEFEYPNIDVSTYIEKLDGFAEMARAKAETSSGPHLMQRALNYVLFEELGFRGNNEDYHDPKNSFLNEVIDRRLGIPITLSVLYIETGKRLGLDLAGMSFPGHFLVRYEGENGVFVLDPFNEGSSLTPEELGERLKRVVGPNAHLTPEHLDPATNREIVSRILSNLAAVYRRAGDNLRNLAVAERIHILDPDNERVENEIAVLRKRITSLN